MANLWELCEEIAEGGPSKTSSRDSLFGEQIIKDQPELSTSFYAEQNPADQAPPYPFQPFSLKEYQPPSPLKLPMDHWTNHNDFIYEPSTSEWHTCKRIWLEQAHTL